MKHLDIPIEWIDFLLKHLHHESKLLDRAIESAIEVKNKLQTQRADIQKYYQQRAENDSLAFSQIDQNERTRKYLGKVQRRILRMSAPVLASRKKLSALLQSLAGKGNPPASLTSIAMSISSDKRNELLALKREIIKKHQQFTALSMSNQTVLIYTLNHYAQILGNGMQNDVYNANGQATEASVNSSYVKTNC